MVTLGNLKNYLDALAQLRRFDPSIAVLCDGRPVTGISTRTLHNTETGQVATLLEITTKEYTK